MSLLQNALENGLFAVRSDAEEVIALCKKFPIYD